MRILDKLSLLLISVFSLLPVCAEAATILPSVGEDNKTIWYIVGGVVLVVGLFLVFRKKD